MALRWQVMKKTDQGVLRATTNSDQTLKALVEEAQKDPNCRWIVVKDRVLNRRGLVWKRSQGEEIDWWCLEDTPPEITFKKNTGF